MNQSQLVPGLVAVLALGAACDHNVLRTGSATPVKPVAPVQPVPVAVDGGCAPGLVACGGSGAGFCFDVRSSSAHCGTCGTACAPGVPCEAGQCRVVPCTSRLTVQSLRVDRDFGFVYQMAVGDFDRDGVLDLFGPTPGSLRGQVDASGFAFSPAGTLFMGTGDGTFSPRAIELTGAAPSLVPSFATATADFNRDQILDLVTAADAGDLLPSNRVAAQLRLGQGDGTFGPPLDVLGPSQPSFITTGDLDGDGILDLVTLANQSSTVTVHRGNGDGTFSNRQELTVAGWPVAVTVIDWNRDGIADLVANEEYLHILLGSGNGSFASALDCGLSLAAATGSPRALVVGDFDRDGLLDLVSSNAIHFGMQGCGSTRSTAFSVAYDSAFPLAAADLDGDGAVDLAVAYADGIGFLSGDGRGNFGALNKLADLDAVHGVPDSNAAMALDANADGRLDLFVGSQYSARIFVNTCE